MFSDGNNCTNYALYIMRFCLRELKELSTFCMYHDREFSTLKFLRDQLKKMELKPVWERNYETKYKK